MDGPRQLLGVSQIVRPVTAGSAQTALRCAEIESQELGRDFLHFSRSDAAGQMARALVEELIQPLTAIAIYLTAARRLLSRREVQRTGSGDDHRPSVRPRESSGANHPAPQLTSTAPSSRRPGPWQAGAGVVARSPLAPRRGHRRRPTCTPNAAPLRPCCAVPMANSLAQAPYRQVPARGGCIPANGGWTERLRRKEESIAGRNM